MKLSNWVFGFLYIFLSVIGISACGDAEPLKLTREDRLAVDGASNDEIIKISNEMDVWCRDSSDAMIKKAVDSMLIARQAEINQAAAPNVVPIFPIQPGGVKK